MKNNNHKNIGIILFSILSLSLALIGWAAPVQATVKSVSGKVEYAKPNSQKFEALLAGQSLAPGSTVRTGADGEAVIVTVPGSAIRMANKTELVLSEMDFGLAGKEAAKKKALIDLKSGTVSALIKKNETVATDFKIKTPQGVAAARGTFYAVTVENGKAYVAVEEGKVGMKRLLQPSDSQ